ncbi:MAG: hypothetical protein H8D23_28550 [Candidatus Brocadiales bacterium]|nr:hypothetical protein [Candidatus Brocadiales bacterium]
MIKFILLSTQRSGTYLFNSVFNSHPDIHIYDEGYFNEWDYSPQQKHHFYNYWLKRIAKDPNQITNRQMLQASCDFIQEHYNSKNHLDAVGWDIKYDFWEGYNFVARSFLAIKPKVIHLIRQNTLKLFISLFFVRCNDNNIKKGAFSHPIFSPLRRENDRQVSFILNKNLINSLLHFENRRDYFVEMSKANFETLEISYERLVGVEEKEVDTFDKNILRTIYKFLEIKRVDFDVSTNMKKINSPNLKDIITNFDQTFEYLKTAKLGRYFV